MNENKKAVVNLKPVTCDETVKMGFCTGATKMPATGTRASGFSPKAVKLYKASKMRFLASQKKK
ncbi:hypothetical protein R5W24_004899 [Gemmata sp. JC717]|uniref:hypothetical protein n=1 Tax=Gemmata algarum TaxID=2975278 RepID=UPI0021BA521C|nr:hypothetical protein [Gemmata algarum]MDY3555753.1 hypothetical protein [Gemmata algarum]